MFDVDKGQLKEFPRPVIWWVYLMSMSVLLQGLADIVLKVGGYAGVMVKFPWRMDFLFLTVISVLMGYQTLIGMRRRELDVTRNSVQIGLLVEIGLVVGDVYFVLQNYDWLPEALVIRAPFIVFTTLNIFILLYIVWKLSLFRDVNGEWKVF